MKTYKITQNGFIWIYDGGLRTGSYFYHKGDEKIWEEAGYKMVVEL